MKIKAIFFDIDGTLISIRHHRIPESTLAAVEAVRQAGVLTFLCTSRARQFLSNIPGIDYDGLVCLTGAHCIDKQGRNLSCVEMNARDIAASVIDAQRFRKPFIGLASDRIYVTEPNHPAVLNALATGGLKVEDVSGGFLQFPDLTASVDPEDVAASLGILQVTAFFPSGPMEDKAMALMPHSHTERWTEAFVDIISNDASKAVGLDVMAGHFGFSVKEAMAIGDGANDIPMIRHAGIGIAMGNASPKVKDAADFVTGDVDEGGLAAALEKFIL